MVSYTPSIDQLKKALVLAERIETLRSELDSMLNNAEVKPKRGRPPLSDKPAKEKGKRQMSPEAREKIAAAQRKRWAKSKRADKKAAAE